MSQIEEVLNVYNKAINKIDDYFEYRNESVVDRKYVKMILNQLNDELEKISRGGQDV